VLPLRVRGVLPPLFCVAPAAGLALSYTGLLPSMPDRPVYGLQLLGEHPTVADLAADLVRRVREIQPVGPYYLLGTSFGGLIAHEMAAQLQGAGEPVALVALLDSYPFPKAWRDLPALSESEFAAGVGDLSPGQVALAYKAFVHHSHLGFAWTPRRVTGGVLHFRATEDKTPDWPGPETWLSHVDGHVVTYEVVCTHNEMTSAGPLAEIGAVITENTELRRVS
jgi:thioesterase domain-containing protein